MSLKNKVFHGILWVFITTASMKIVNLAISMILARLLEPSDFGLMAISLMIINFFEIFREFGIDQGVIQRKDSDNVANSAFFIYPSISFILYLLIYFIAPISAEYFKEDGLNEVVRVISLSLIIWSFGSLPKTLITKNLDFKKLVAPQLLPRITYGVVTILLASKGFGVWSLVWGKIAMEVISVLIFWYIIDWRPSLRFDTKIAYELLSYGKHVIIANVIIFFVSMVDTAVIGHRLGSENLGYYSIALTISGIFTTQISTTLSQVMFPVYSKIQENRNKLRWAYIATLKGISMITFPAAFGILSVAWYFINVFYGDKWLPSVIALQVLCIYGLSISILNISKNLYLAVGKPQIMTKIYIIQFFIILILIYPLTDKYNILGTSLAVTISAIVAMFFTFKEAGKIIDLNSLNFIKSIFPSFLGSIFMLLFIFSFQNLCSFLSPVLILFFSIILGICLYYLFFRLVYKKELEDIKWLINIRNQS